MTLWLFLSLHSMVSFGGFPWLSAGAENELIFTASMFLLPAYQTSLCTKLIITSKQLRSAFPQPLMAAPCFPAPGPLLVPFCLWKPLCTAECGSSSRPYSPTSSKELSTLSVLFPTPPPAPRPQLTLTVHVCAPCELLTPSFCLANTCCDAFFPGVVGCMRRGNLTSGLAYL